MKNIQITPAQEIAHVLDDAQAELDRHVAAQLSNFFTRANTPGLEQAILDEMGAGAVSAVISYAAYHLATGIANSPATPAAKIALMQAIQTALITQEFPLLANAPAPDFTAFQPQSDGTVVFVPPAPPEAPEEAP